MLQRFPVNYNWLKKNIGGGNKGVTLMQHNGCAVDESLEILVGRKAGG